MFEPIFVTCKSVMLRTRSPTKMKSPRVLRYKAMMLLKYEHSSLSSLSAVHSQRRTYILSIIQCRKINYKYNRIFSDSIYFDISQYLI